MRGVIFVEVRSGHGCDGELEDLDVLGYSWSAIWFFYSRYADDVLAARMQSVNLMSRAFFPNPARAAVRVVILSCTPPTRELCNDSTENSSRSQQQQQLQISNRGSRSLWLARTLE